MAKPNKSEREDQRRWWLDKVEARLRAYTTQQRVALIEELIGDFFVIARATLVKWSHVTGQSAQIDTGYIAQHLASIVLRSPGQGFKGKGIDLRDGSEVKSASIVSGVDRPRWNHNMGTAADDAKRRAAGKSTKGDTYLDCTPFVFYVLFDRVHGEDMAATARLRVRGWCINARRDEPWRDLMKRYLSGRQGNTYNLQLHPPVGYDDSIVVNELGNLDMAATLVLDIRFSLPSAGERLDPEWVVQRLDITDDWGETSKAQPWVRGARPSRLEAGLEGLTNLENLQVGFQGDVPVAASESGVPVVAADTSELDELPENNES